MQAIFVDAAGGEPAWVIAKLGRFGKAVAIPIHDCAAVAGRVWVPYEREVVRGAPSVDPAQPFAREHELAICAHYGIHEGFGRAAEVAARAAGSRHRRAGAGAGADGPGRRSRASSRGLGRSPSAAPRRSPRRS